MSTLLQTCGRTKVLLATPAYGDLSAPYVLSLFETARMIECDLLLLTGHCHVDDSRNSVVRTFLDGPWQELVFLDSDVSWKASDLQRLLSHDVDVVAGAYPLKQDEPKYPVQWLGDEVWGDRRGLVEVRSVATGMLAIKRHVLQTLWDGAAKFKAKHTDAKETAEIFNRTIIDGERIGGDVHFCYKWREAGGKVYLDPDMTLGHTGEKTWSGNVGLYIMGCEKGELQAGFDRIRQGRVDPHVFEAVFKAWGNDYAAGPGLLSACYHLSRSASGAILEFGSGLSTLVMAAANPDKDVVAVEYNPAYGAETRQAAEDLGIDNLRLVMTTIRNGWYEWRSTERFGLVLVDGPSRKIASRGACILPDADTYIFDDAGDGPIMAASKALASEKDFGHVHLNAGQDRSFVIVHKRQELKAA